MFHSVTLTMPDLDFDKPGDAVAHFLEVSQWARPLTFELVNADGVASHLVLDTADAPAANDTVDALTQAESFISGFEDDETQEGIADMLAGLRAAIARERAKPVLIAEAKELLRNATFADGQGTILTQDAEALERAIAAAEGRANG